MLGKKNIVAIVPVKGNSERVKKKNLAVVVYLIVSILIKNGEVAQLVRAQDS